VNGVQKTEKGERSTENRKRPFSGKLVVGSWDWGGTARFSLLAASHAPFSVLPFQLSVFSFQFSVLRFLFRDIYLAVG